MLYLTSGDVTAAFSEFPFLAEVSITAAPRTRLRSRRCRRGRSKVAGGVEMKGAWSFQALYAIDLVVLWKSVACQESPA